MLVEHGFSRVISHDGTEYTFRPSFGRIVELGRPGEIIHIFRDLFGRYAGRAARHILVTLCDQEDVTPLIGWLDEKGWHQGQMPEGEQIVLAAHLMRHGLVGAARADKNETKAAEEFLVSEYVAAARVHLLMSAAEAEALSMTELHELFEMKFPDAKKKKRDVPTREEYRAAMAAKA